jgi:hypothetical protein
MAATTFRIGGPCIRNELRLDVANSRHELTGVVRELKSTEEQTRSRHTSPSGYKDVADIWDLVDRRATRRRALGDAVHPLDVGLAEVPAMSIERRPAAESSSMMPSKMKRCPGKSPGASVRRVEILGDRWPAVHVYADARIWRLPTASCMPVPCLRGGRGSAGSQPRRGNAGSRSACSGPTPPGRRYRAAGRAGAVRLRPESPCVPARTWRARRTGVMPSTRSGMVGDHHHHGYVQARPGGWLPVAAHHRGSRKGSNSLWEAQLAGSSLSGGWSRSRSVPVVVRPATGPVSASSGSGS